MEEKKQLSSLNNIVSFLLLLLLRFYSKLKIRIVKVKFKSDI